MENSQSVPAVCWAVIDCGLQDWQYTDPDSHEVRVRAVRELRIGFELADEVDASGRHRVLTRWYARSFSKRSNLYRDLTSWTGSDTLAGCRADHGGFDWSLLLGRGAFLTLERHNGFRRIVGLRPFPAQYRPDRRMLLFDLDRFDVEAFHRLPDKIRNHVLRSPTFVAMHGQPHVPHEHIRPETGRELLDDEIPW